MQALLGPVTHQVRIVHQMPQMRLVAVLIAAQRL